MIKTTINGNSETASLLPDERGFYVLRPKETKMTHSEKMMRMWEILHFTTDCSAETVDAITRIFGETEEVYGKILYYYEGYYDFTDYLKEVYDVNFESTKEVSELFRKMAKKFD